MRLAGLALAWTCVGIGSLTAGASGLPTFAVRLTTSLTLPDGVRSALVREVDAIWQREGVRVIWTGDAVDAATSVADIRVLVVSAPGALASAGEHAWPVAELLRDQQAQPVAIASVDAARRVLEASRRTGEPDALVARRLGVVLGRAVAHELGHFLLQTATHARHGLMRTRISADDFADLRVGGFGLDAAAATWVRASLAPQVPTELRLARFAYPR